MNATNKREIKPSAPVARLAVPKDAAVTIDGKPASPCATERGLDMYCPQIGAIIRVTLGGGLVVTVTRDPWGYSLMSRREP